MPRSRSLLGAIPVLAIAFGLSGGPADAALGSAYWQVLGGASGDALGWAVAGVSDLDGDGLGDVVVGVPDRDVSGLSNVGTVQVRSGHSGSLLWSANGDRAGGEFGKAVAGVPDLDGDGYGDVVVGSPQDRNPAGADAGSIDVFSGRTGHLLWSAYGDTVSDGFGSAVAGVPDVDGDGYGDVVVGAPNDDPASVTNAGTVYVYSGASGTLLWKAGGTGTDDHLGAAVAGVEDLNGDGRGEVIVGAPDDDAATGVNAGSVLVFSGASGSLLWSVSGNSGGDRFGCAVAGAPDLQGTGSPGVVVGAQLDDPSGRSNAGSVYALAGSNGATLWTAAGAVASDFFGTSVAAGSDVDDDGYGDVVVGAPQATVSGHATVGAAYVLSGHDGTSLWQTPLANSLDAVGRSVACVPDVDGDGRGDVVVGANGVDGPGLTDAGQASVYATQESVPDATAPVIVCPDDVVAAATGPTGAIVTFSVSATDDVDAAPRVTCEPASGSRFPLGTTTVTCTAVDSAGNTSTCSFTVSVVDVNAPTVTCPDDVVAEATGPGGTTVAFTASATDDVDAAPTVTCEPASGSTFPLGTTTVTCTAVDAAGNSSACSFTVTVVDTTPPTVSVSVATASLWPPDHRMADVGLSVTATDLVDTDPTVTITVYSDEPAAPGETDVVLSGSSLSLRADRNGTGDGRVYLIVVTATDDSGNSSTASCTVVVPKSDSKVQTNAAKAQAADAAATASGGVAPSSYVTLLSETSLP